MAVTFNGTTQYLSGGPSYDFGATSTSISYWEQRSTSAVHEYLMGRQNGVGDKGWVLNRTNAADNTEYRVTMVGGSGSSAWTVSGSWSLNTWRHFLYIFTASGTVHELYVDGTSAGTSTSAGPYGAALAGTGLYLGATNTADAPAGYYAGKCAELAIWHNVDVSSLVGQLRTGASAGKAPNNIGSNPNYYWPLISNGTATLGGSNFSDNNTPTWDSSAHTGLTIDYAAGGGVALMGQAVF